MAGIESLQELIGLGGIPNAARSYVRGEAIRYLTAAGHSANSILSQLSSAGLGIRRQQGLQMIAAERERVASAASAPQLALGSSTGQLLGTAPPENWTNGKYVHQVTITYRTRDAEGNYLLHQRTVGLKSTSVLTGEQANAGALDIVATNPSGEDGRYPMGVSDVLATTLTGIYYDTQDRNLYEYPVGA